MQIEMTSYRVPNLPSGEHPPTDQPRTDHEFEQQSFEPNVIHEINVHSLNLCGLLTIFYTLNIKINSFEGH